ncbi:hypothetical protein CE11_00074 [Megavirus courdo11]|uniref:Transmembrane protein n=1 Tax=Megavirus courdo11 TaxID=1128140 RepID=K7Z7A8_9VIRU|nr:hypothetical protein CE11_00074 [Megavirus courdo11]
MIIAIVIATSVPIIQFRNRSRWNHADADENGIFLLDLNGCSIENNLGFLQLEFNRTYLEISTVNLNDVAVKRILEILWKNQVVDGSVHVSVVDYACLDYCMSNMYMNLLMNFSMIFLFNFLYIQKLYCGNVVVFHHSLISSLASFKLLLISFSSSTNSNPELYHQFNLDTSPLSITSGIIYLS